MTPLRMVTRTAGCDMVTSSWVCSTVGKFLTFFIKELGDENDPNQNMLRPFVTESIT